MIGFVTPAILGALILLPAIWWLLRGGERIALLGSGRNPASGRGALNTVLAGLDRDTPLDAADRAVPRHATLVLFSDFLDPIDQIAHALERAIHLPEPWN